MSTPKRAWDEDRRGLAPPERGVLDVPSTTAIIRKHFNTLGRVAASVDEPAVELGDVVAGLLPARYGFRMQDVFLARVLERLSPGARVLDLGGGRNPAVPTDLRPSGVHYVGLDISADELANAPPGAYDDTVVHDVTQAIPGQGTYDLVVSWQVLEHVVPLAVALENVRDALKPGGALIAQVSGSFAIFSLAARVMPHRVRVAAMVRLLGHRSESKFPTRYDHCWATALDRSLSNWSEHELVLFYRGAAYLSALRPLQRAYLAYENAVAQRRVRNLATHYLIVATR